MTRELLRLRRTEERLVRQIRDIQARMNRYDSAKQMEMRLATTRLEAKLHATRAMIRQHELP
jgi:hypothetical protein